MDTTTVRITHAQRRALGLLAELQGRRIGTVLAEAVTGYLDRPENAAVLAQLDVSMPGGGQ